MTPRPHDALIKTAFADPAHAAALLREIVPATISKDIAWNTLRGETSSFVDPKLSDRHSDLVFSARLRIGAQSPVYILLEHQSTRDSTMPLRTLSYQSRIWDHVCKVNRAAPLPPILAVLVSHVRGGWTTARTLGELFDPAVRACPGLAAWVPDPPLIIEDLAQRSNADLLARSLAAFPKLALWLLRDARAPRRLLASFDLWLDTFAAAERAPDGRDAITTLLTYLFGVVKPMHHDELRAKLAQLGSRTKEITMSILDMWHEQGRAEGRKQGRAEERIAILRRLVLFKFGGQSLGNRYEAMLRNATPKEIEGYLRRVLTADSLAAVFKG